MESEDDESESCSDEEDEGDDEEEEEEGLPAFIDAADVEAPLELQCPLSLELVIDPVGIAAGQTYERSAIENWLFTDPITGVPLEHTHVRSLCRKYMESA